MVERTYYLERLEAHCEKPIIKVISGVRRCGKSTVLKQFQDKLRLKGIEDKQIIHINFEYLEFEELKDYQKLHAYILGHCDSSKTSYVFLDEIQEVAQFERVVASLYARDGIDLYITGSSAHLLSGELATLLGGRYVEIAMLPLSFAEYHELVGGNSQAAWDTYFARGGFPYAAQLKQEEDWRDYITGLYNTILIKDIMLHNQVRQPQILDSLMRFLSDSVGSLVSPKKISDSLVSYGRKTSSITVESYIQALDDAQILYKAGRYDAKGKQHLRLLQKYYLVDLAFRRLLIADSIRDRGHLLENIIYLELKRRGYDVSVGVVDKREVDFVATKWGEISYFQVAASINDTTTFEREITPLKVLDDNYPKTILTLDNINTNENGIKVQSVLDFLQH